MKVTAFVNPSITANPSFGVASGAAALPRPAFLASTTTAVGSSAVDKHCAGCDCPNCGPHIEGCQCGKCGAHESECKCFNCANGHSLGCECPNCITSGPLSKVVERLWIRFNFLVKKLSGGRSIIILIMIFNYGNQIRTAMWRTRYRERELHFPLKFYIIDGERNK